MNNPVKQYEPFFTTTHEYEDEAELAFWGVTPILRYDPLGRLVRTELPDGTTTRVAFTPWQSATFDGNDTVLDAGHAWYASRQANAVPTPSAEEQRAATLTAAHAGTAALALVLNLVGLSAPCLLLNLVGLSVPSAGERTATSATQLLISRTADGHLGDPVAHRNGAVSWWRRRRWMRVCRRSCRWRE